ncbi:hypothetical protein B0H13DRAFT_1856153 [Mycena leptocephala]|jgi:2-C-methyl-D-erythritol 4-phosphate cytidylyltransferase|nr:hypothetical protein B0H13DRAFT_1856153 [Mycena leptocephala]
MSGAAAILDDFDRDIPPTAVLTQGFSDMQADPVATHDLARALYHLAVVRPVYVGPGENAATAAAVRGTDAALRGIDAAVAVQLPRREKSAAHYLSPSIAGWKAQI